jgi:PAS domain S-box-containing protein
MSLPPTLSPPYFGVSLKPGGAVARYLSAVGATIVAAVLTQALLHWMGSAISPVFSIAVVLVSAYAGLRPGLFCAVLSAIACNVLFVSSVGPEDLIRLATFMIVALLVSSLTMARQEAEDAAKAAEKQLSITLKSIGNAVITTDAKGRVVFMNSIAQSLTGWILPEASGRHIEEIFQIAHPETQCALETVATRVLRDSVVLALGDPAHMIARDGTRIYVDQVGAPVRDHRGNIKGLVVVLRTIPEPKPNDPDRLLAETIGLLDAVDVNMVAIDLDKRCAFVSKSTAQLLGYQVHELVGREIHELTGFRDLEVFSDEPPVKNKKNVLSSGTLQRRDGTAVPVDFSRAPLMIAEQVVGTVVTITDLTERRRAETAITRLESIENSVDEGIILHTADGVISSWNRAAERIYGYCEEEVLGRHISIIHPPGYKQELQSLFDRVLAQKRIEPLETVRIRKGGERVFVSINAVLLDDGLNAEPCIAQIVTDQTLLKKAEATALLARNNPNGHASASSRRVNRPTEAKSSAVSDQPTINDLLTSPAARVKSTHSPVLVGTSPVMKKLFTTIDRVAATDNSVLITGQTGTGKELVARAIHNKSQRAAGPFIDLNCSAIPETLIEAELFGHQRGTFTGAHENRVGLFEAASGGTLFLDEVDALPLAAQAKLLRVLQEKRIRRVGGRTNIDVDVRIISATNSDLNTAINEGRFRADLFYRLRVFPVSVPALSQRGGDVEMLIEYFLRRHAELYGTSMRSFTPVAMNALLRYSWPGNVRELESAVEYALAIGTEEELGIEDLPAEFSAADASARGPVADFHTDGVPLAEIEKRYILSVLEQFEGNQVRAAAALGIDRSKLYRRLRQYGVKAVKFLQEERGDGRQLLSSLNGKPQGSSDNLTDNIAQSASAA